MIQTKSTTVSLDTLKKQMSKDELTRARSLFNKCYHEMMAVIGMSEELALQLKIQSAQTVINQRF